MRLPKNIFCTVTSDIALKDRDLTYERFNINTRVPNYSEITKIN